MLKLILKLIRLFIAIFKAVRERESTLGNIQLFGKLKIEPTVFPSRNNSKFDKYRNF